MKIKTRLMISILFVAVVPLVASVSALGLFVWHHVQASSLAAISDKLVAVREIQKTRVEKFINDQQALTSFISRDPNTILAAENFTKSFILSQSVAQEDAMALEEFYTNDFYQQYKRYELDVEKSVAQRLYSGLDPAAAYYQQQYIVDNPHDINEKHKLIQGEKRGRFTARYDLYHAEYHPSLLLTKQAFSFNDLYIVSPEGRVVYSVQKHVDYGTSLDSGPFAKSGLGIVWRQALNLEPGKVALSDFMAHEATSGATSIFMSTPIFRDGNLAGVLVVQIKNQLLTDVLTSNTGWRTVGLGNTGEVFLVGEDRRLRSESRKLLEHPNDYFTKLAETGWQDKTNTIKSRNESAGYQKVQSLSVDRALSGESGVILTDSYYGEPVLSAFSPMNILGLRWAIISEISEQEAFMRENAMFLTASGYALGVIVCALFFASLLGILVARKIVNPLRELVSTFDEIAQGEGNLAIELKTARRVDEIGELSSSFNSFVSNIRSVVAEVITASLALGKVAKTLKIIASESSFSMEKQRKMTNDIALAMPRFAEDIQGVATGSQATLDAMNQVDLVTRSGRDSSEDSKTEIFNLSAKIQDSAKAIDNLSDEIDEISRILKNIDGIAEQTSLLALNAAIEAARAGEQGRGFAVVADEVRNLSSRTQQATVDIQTKIDRLSSVSASVVRLVESSQENAGSGTELVNQTALKLGEVQELVSRVKQRHELIASSVIQQQGRVQDIELTIVNIDQLCEKTRLKSVECTTITADLESLASKLNQQVGRFQV